MRVLSLGAGVNSTALLVLKAQGKVDFDLAIFADTGGEQPETYQYLNEDIKPFCEKNNIKLVIVKKEGTTLYRDSFERKIIPTRMFRSCTDKFKIRVIRAFLIKNYPNENIVTLIGFCKGEEKRQANAECGSIAPLIELGIDREGCMKLIADAGLPIPIKSGCYYCPFQPQKSWLNLLKNHPDLYGQAEALEKNGSRYPEMVLPFTMNLEGLRKTYEAMQKATPKDKETIQQFLYYTMPKTPSCPMCELEDNECG